MAVKKVREGYKITELGEIPEKWSVKKIEDICEVKGGKRLPKGVQLLDTNNGFPYIRVADMYMGGINTNDIKYVPLEAVEKIKNYRINKEDLFISVAGTIGIVGTIPENLDGANLTENADKLCNIKINKEYLLWSLQSDMIQKIIESEKTTNAQPKLALTRIKEFLIPIPNVKEQQKISLILSSVDEQIEITDNLIEKTKELKKGLMQKLLTKGIGHSRFKDTEIGKIPEEWKVENLGNVTEIVRGASPRPKGDPKYYGGNVPRLMISDVTRDGKYVTPRTDFLTEEGAKKSRPMSKGDLIISISGTVALPTFLAVDSCIHDGFMGFKKIDKNLNKDFLYYQILFLREKLIRSATDGGVYINLTTDIVKEFKITIPLLEEQKQITSILSSVDEQIEQYESKKEKLQELKNGLMQKLLTGKIRVK